jgi:hypothetical protein
LATLQVYGGTISVMVGSQSVSSIAFGGSSTVSSGHTHCSDSEVNLSDVTIISSAAIGKSCHTSFESPAALVFILTIAIAPH